MTTKGPHLKTGGLLLVCGHTEQRKGERLFPLLQSDQNTFRFYRVSVIRLYLFHRT